MKPIRPNSRTAATLALSIAVLALTTTGCGNGSNPTAPNTPVLALTSADVLVMDESVSGQTVSRGHNEGGSTRFQAQLMLDGSPAIGHEAWIQFDRPQGMGMGMGRHTGLLQLHDDGTNGDLMAGDGIYSYEDHEGEYGCHSDEAGAGEYHYEFYGTRTDGHESNHMTVTVTVTD